MRYLRRFNEDLSIYDKRWKSFLPKEIWVIKGGDGKHKFTKGNIMLNSDMIQITYNNTEKVIPDTLEIDIYFVKNVQNGTDSTITKSGGDLYTGSNGDGFIRLTIDITYGDLVACEFSIDKNGVKLIQDTTKKSKFDPSNTIFAFDDLSLTGFIEFLNRFNIFKINQSNLYFLQNK